MNRVVKFGKGAIGDGFPCFIIAEIGSNHNGSFDRALALIDAAVEAKADAVKFQTFKAEEIYPPKAGTAGYLKTGKSIFEIIKEMEMPEEWIPRLAKYCAKKKIIFLSTPFDKRSADLLEDHVPFFKIASYELTDVPLVEHIAKKNKPIILSTGTADLAEVKESVRIIKKTGNKNLVLMQCTACYPTPIDSVNVKTIITMKNAFHVPVGLSDHSREFDIAPLAAVACGANCIEKHFTLSNNLPGPDHKFAIEPQELKWMVQKIRQTEQALGTGEKVTLGVEKELKSFARRFIFAAQDIKKGEVFTQDNIVVLRRGNLPAYIGPKYYDSILGKRSNSNINSGYPLKKNDF